MSITPPPFPVTPILPPPASAFQPIFTFPDNHELVSPEGVEAIKKVVSLLREMQNILDGTFIKLSSSEAETLCFILKTLTERSTRLMETLVTTTIVIAGDHAQYKEWCEVRKRDPDEYIYINKPEQIRGMHFVKVECIGTWFNRRDILEIMQELGMVNQV